MPADQIDPMRLDKSYYLEPDKAATKPYILLRDALVKEKRMAICTVSIRTRMTMAVLRVRDGVIVMQTMLWPDEIRGADFAAVDDDQHASKQEMDMAKMLIDQLAGDYEPSEYEDDYAIAVKELVRAKVEGGEVRVSAAEPEESGEVVDLLAALARSVEKAKASRGEAPDRARSSSARLRREERHDEERPPRRPLPKKATAKKTTGEEDRRQEGREEGELSRRAGRPRPRRPPARGARHRRPRPPGAGQRRAHHVGCRRRSTRRRPPRAARFRPEDPEDPARQPDLTRTQRGSPT